ncbi:MAG: hypothetical protein EA426_16770 [Spirochaetaceae bacterium]|nr:MAG: hypothetical protein EA426_16770 [Spirochaetaceae bacterium]
MRKLMTLGIVALALGVLAGCGRQADPPPAPTGFVPNQGAVAYNYVHGGYVGVAKVTTNAEGAITVILDEAFLPHTLAAVDIESADWTEDNTVFYEVRGNKNYVAKYVAYNGRNYVGTTVGTSVTYVAADDQGNPAGNTDLEMEIIRNEARMAEWFEKAQAGGFQIFTQFGGTPIPVTTTAYGGVTKRGSTYWNFGLGWQGNIEAVEAAAQQHGVRFGLDELRRRSDDNRWAMADVVTSATLSDFPDYFGLIQLAVARLKMQ